MILNFFVVIKNKINEMKINYNFNENSAFIEILGDEPDKLYLVKFLNLENNEIIYTTKIHQNNWSTSSRKTDCIRVFDENNTLIFEKINDIKDAMNFNDTSISYIGPFSPNDLFLDIEDNIKNPLAIICPHAGYYFSGKVAAKSFSVIDKEKKYENIFILSSSHTAGYKGGSLCTNQYYNTPYGILTINNDICNELNNSDLLNFNNDHFKTDHTINMILPFIVERIKLGYKIVPIMIGDSNYNNLKDISNILKPYLNENNLFIISSDFSHYPSYDDALIVDNETIKAIVSNDSKTFLSVVHNNNKPNLLTRMCGWSSYLILLYMIENKNMKINIEEYKNSGDASGDKSGTVVGYSAINFCYEVVVNESDKKILTDIVRKTLKQYLDDGSVYQPVKP
jgi:AmmeMemoRadiSam system protein B